MVDKKTQKILGVDVENVGEAIESLDQLKQEIDDGLLQEMFPNSEETIEAAKAYFGLADEDVNTASREKLKERTREILEGVFQHGLMLKDAMGMSPQTMESFYFLGYQMFERQKYPHALHVFKILTQLDPTEYKYFYGMATTMQELKDYPGAIQNYMMAATLNPETHDPVPHYHLADCYVKVGDTFSALISLGMCMESCQDGNEEHQVIKERAKVLYDAYTQKLHEEVDQEEVEKKAKSGLEELEEQQKAQEQQASPQEEK